MTKAFTEVDFRGIITDPVTRGKKELYQQEFVNYSGVTSDTKRKYSEVVAEDIYNQVMQINASKVDESKEKLTEGPLHEKADVKYTPYAPNDIKRNEENIAKRLVQSGCNTRHNSGVFTVVDYQIPVNRVNHSVDGKIDLILTSNEGVIIGELKDDKSPESLLRAILEIQTYYEKVSHEKLTRCYGKKFVGKAILLFENTRPFEELNNVEHVYVNKLLRKWDIRVFQVKDVSTPMTLDYEHKIYEISII